MERIVWHKPQIVEIAAKDLMCRIEARATSPCKDSSNYLEESACPEMNVADTWCHDNPEGIGEGGGGDGTCQFIPICTIHIF